MLTIGYANYLLGSGILNRRESYPRLDAKCEFHEKREAKAEGIRWASVEACFGQNVEVILTATESDQIQSSELRGTIAPWPSEEFVILLNSSGSPQSVPWSMVTHLARGDAPGFGWNGKYGFVFDECGVAKTQLQDGSVAFCAVGTRFGEQRGSGKLYVCHSYPAALPQLAEESITGTMNRSGICGSLAPRFSDTNGGYLLAGQTQGSRSYVFTDCREAVVQTPGDSSRRFCAIGTRRGSLEHGAAIIGQCLTPSLPSVSAVKTMVKTALNSSFICDQWVGMDDDSGDDTGGFP